MIISALISHTDFDSVQFLPDQEAPLANLEYFLSTKIIADFDIDAFLKVRTEIIPVSAQQLK